MSQEIDSSRDRLVQAIYNFTVAASTRNEVDLAKYTLELEGAAGSADSATIKSVVGRYGSVSFNEAAEKVKNLFGAAKEVRDVIVRLGQ